MIDLLVLAAAVFAFGLISRRLEGTILTAPLVFVAAGVILGPAAFGVAEFALDEHTVLLLSEIALAVVLFTDAAQTNLRNQLDYLFDNIETSIIGPLLESSGVTISGADVLADNLQCTGAGVIIVS